MMLQPWETPRTTSGFPWKAGTQRNPVWVETRSQQVEGFLNGCPVWQGQGEGKSGAGGRTGEWELAPRPLLPAAFCHLCSQQGYSNYTLTLKMYVLSFGGKL